MKAGNFFWGIFFFYMLSVYSCSTMQKGLFAKKTSHKIYEDKLINAGLEKTLLGSLWFNAAVKSVQSPLTIELPYRESGYFSADFPNAAGFRFNARQGEVIHITVSTKPDSLTLFTDMWRQEENGSLLFLAAADTANSINITLEKDALYQLRLQPELLYAGEYTLTITTGPSLAFPVPAEDKPKIGSFWGASRDHGARKHEGIDIFGKFRTPVVAAANGYIASTRENALGGKVIFLRPEGKNYSLYYAHLDSQLVREGQQVNAGEIIGLMGNTGNAKNTPTHLHFGVYTNTGAVDPLPFVNNNRPVPDNITGFLALFNNNARIITETSLNEEPNAKAKPIKKLSAGNLVKVIAVTGSWYKARLTDNSEGYIKNNLLSKSLDATSYITLKEDEPLHDRPDKIAASKLIIPAGTKLAVYAKENGFYYAEHKHQYGWFTED